MHHTTETETVTLAGPRPHLQYDILALVAQPRIILLCCSGCPDDQREVCCRHVYKWPHIISLPGAGLQPKS